MAIPFLNNINLDDNQLQNAKLHVTSSAPTAAAGQIYFDSTVGTEAIKYYSNTTDQWITLSEYGFTGDTFINITKADTNSTDAKQTVTVELSATGTPDSTTFLRGDNTWATVVDNNTTYDLAGYGTTNGTAGIELVGSDSTTDQVSITGAGTTEVTQSGNAITITSNDQYTGTLTGVTEGAGITVTASSTSPTVAIDYLGADNYLLEAGAATTAASADIINFSDATDSNVKQTTLGNIPVEALTDVKTYIDNSVAGGLVYQGGYNAATNTPALDTNLNITAMGTGGGPISGVYSATTTTGSGSGMTIYVELNSAGNIIVARVVDGGSGYTTGSTVSVSGAISGHTGSYFTIPSVPISGIEKGWTYTVTADGYFYNEQVRVGDVLVAEIDNPTALEDWTTVQNNIDLASLTQVGIGNVNASTGIGVSYSSGTATVSNTGVTSLAAGEGIDVSGSTGAITVSAEDSSATNKGIVIVSPGEAIDVSYSSGTATVSVEDSTASNKGAVIVSAGTGISVSYASGTATVTNSDTNSDNTFSGTIGDGSSTSLTVTSATHGLGTDSSSFMIQLVEVSSGETVYADVTRGASGLVTVDFATAPATNAIRVLIQKIG
jgi:hypothetical protein